MNGELWREHLYEVSRSAALDSSLMDVLIKQLQAQPTTKRQAQDIAVLRHFTRKRWNTVHELRQSPHLRYEVK